MSKPLLYDVFSGAGGCAKGYQMAGFRVVAVDSKPQPRCCADETIQMDAFEFFSRVQVGEFPPPDVWHCSPPCPAYSRMRHLPWLKGREYPRLIKPVLEFLDTRSEPWVLENVADAAPEFAGRWKVTLCGLMFGLKVYRHRLFASNVMLMAPSHPTHKVTIGKGRLLNDRAGASAEGFVSLPSKPTRKRPFIGLAAAGGTPLNGLSPSGDRVTVAGHFSGMDAAKAAMGITWMNRYELSQAIPPSFTNYLGCQIISILNSRADSANCG